jgi:hypothetical protein
LVFAALFAEKEMKRKFFAKNCVLCLRGEDQVIVDTDQFAYLSACLDTIQDVAICLVPHEKTKDNYLHQNLPFSVDDPDNFVAFLTNKECGPHTDFVKFKQLLDFLGASNAIMGNLKACAYAANDAIGVTSAYQAFQIVSNRQDLLDVLPLNNDLVDFAMAHDLHHKLLPVEQIETPDCVPEALLDLIDPIKMHFGGEALIPGLRRLAGDYVAIELFPHLDRVSLCKQIVNILIESDYIVLCRGMNYWDCIAPPNYHNVRLRITSFKDVKHIVGTSRLFEHGFYLVSKSEVQMSVETKNALLKGCNFHEASDAISYVARGMPALEKHRKALQELTCKPSLRLMQIPGASRQANVYQLVALRNFTEVHSVEDLQIVENFQNALDVISFYESCTINSIIVSDFQFGLSFSGCVSLCQTTFHNTQYSLATLSNNVEYVVLCELLSKRLGCVICSTVAFVKDSPLLKTDKFHVCTIRGVVAKVLYWQLVE